MDRVLVAFDFDHTVVDDNTDTAVVQSVLPEEVTSKYVSGRWTQYMNDVFHHLHSEQGVTIEQMKQAICSIPLTPGMEALLAHLGAHADIFDVVIVSDSNTQFIQWILQHQQLHPIFSSVYTNPATVTAEGRLTVAHHHNHDCSICPVNMCKRAVLMQRSAAAGGPYSRVVYVGDGGNDYCPALGMSPEDILFVREGYKLQKLLQSQEKLQQLRCQVQYWQDAGSIKDWLLANVHAS
jgi:pyridoxal phosphate phosphatase PHOSPHO2